MVKCTIVWFVTNIGILGGNHLLRKIEQNAIKNRLTNLWRWDEPFQSSDLDGFFDGTLVVLLQSIVEPSFLL